jgi:hypothetical protein
MQVGLIRFRRTSLAPPNARDRITLQTFFDGAVWRYAASLAGSAEICRSAYY